MSRQSFNVEKSLCLKPIDPSTLTTPKNGELVIDSTDSNKLKKYNESNTTWEIVGSGGSTLDSLTDVVITSPTNNQILTYDSASGNFVNKNPQSVGDINTLTQQLFDNAVLGDFTQTGLTLSTSNPIKGTVSALLTHQAATSQSFKQVISVDRKFRGYAHTLSLSTRSTAASANLTILVTDETNSATLLSSSQITTGQITSAVFNTASSTTVTVTDLSILNRIKVGASITGSGIPANTVVTAVGTSTITISNAATATATGVSLKVSVLPVTQKFSFTIPANCSSISYTVTALQESGSPESYIDDVQIYLSQSANSSYSLTVPKAVENDYKFRLDLSTSPSILSASKSGIIQSIVRQSTGIFRITLNSGIFSQYPAVVESLDNTPNNAGQIKINWITQPTVFDIYSTNTGGTLIDNQQVSIIISKLGADYTDPLTATTTNTIPLTSSVLVTQPDSQMTWQGYAGLGSTRTQIPYFTNARTMIGSAISYTSSTTNGLEVTVLEDGFYSINFSLTVGISTTIDVGLGLNLTDFTTNISTRLTDSTILKVAEPAATTTTRDSIELSWSGPLKAGDKLYPMMTGSPNNNPGMSYFSVSKASSTKILNPSSDQKIQIPTHQLRFEGASARGSTDTAIVKFDTQTITQGDGFTVVNTAANGTVVTIKKAGRLSVQTSLYTSGAGSDFFITKNQQTLTTGSIPLQYIMAQGTTSSSTANSISSDFDVIVGDKIRIAWNNTGAIASSSTGSFILSLMETSVAVALQNVSPNWDSSDSEISVWGSNGTGSTNTQVCRFSNLSNVAGNDITYSDSATLGASFLINNSGLYDMSTTIQRNGGSEVGTVYITKNITSVTGTNDLASENILAMATVASNTQDVQAETASIQKYLQKGDIVRIIRFNGVGSPIVTRVNISKVGKTSGTVDVTPFVQIPTQDVEAMEYTNTTTGTGGTHTGALSKNTNKGMLSYNSSTGVYTVLKDSLVNMSCSIFNGSGIYSASNIFINGSLAESQAATTSNVGSNSATTLTKYLLTGDTFYFSTGVGTSTTYTQKSYVTATAQSNSIASSTQQVSSDTMSFVFKSTAIDPNTDAIGTFNTYTYAANTNTATIATTAPTQTTSSMNINGIQVFARAYNATSTAASPARVDIFIGKGLKSKQVDAYAAAAKSDVLSIDQYISGTSMVGTVAFYNEVTGILIIDAGYNNFSAITTRYAGYSYTAGTPTSGYFVFNASKAPSLVTVPQLQPRIAYISEQQAAGTGGGTSVGGSVWTTRTLNTLVDDTGFVTSLSSNQFVLPAGTYDIECTSPLVCNTPTVMGARIRNITDGTTVISQQYYDASTTQDDRPIRAVGRVTITNSKTFALQYFVATGFSTVGLGQNINTGEVNTFGQVKITKIK